MTPTPSHVATDELIETLERLAGDAAAGERNPGAQAFGPSRYVEIRRDTLPQILSALKENKRLREALEAIPELIADQADHDVLAVVWTALQPQFNRINNHLAQHGMLPEEYAEELLKERDALTARVAELERERDRLFVAAWENDTQLVGAYDSAFQNAEAALQDWRDERDKRAAAEARAQAAEAKLETARRDALEEAASECLILERDDAVDCPSGPAWKWYGKSRDHAAARIRALQTKDTTL